MEQNDLTMRRSPGAKNSASSPRLPYVLNDELAEDLDIDDSNTSGRDAGWKSSRRSTPAGEVDSWYHSGTMRGIATNLRLSAEAEEAVRAEARRSGRSQQEVIRAAINRYLSLMPAADSGQQSELARLIASGAVRPPRTPYRRPRRRLRLPGGVTSADLLDRSDRI